MDDNKPVLLTLHEALRLDLIFGPTVRQLMTPTGLGIPGKLRPRVHQSRLRRACNPERIQINVCGHHGFE